MRGALVSPSWGWNYFALDARSIGPQIQSFSISIAGKPWAFIVIAGYVSANGVTSCAAAYQAGLIRKASRRDEPMEPIETIEYRHHTIKVYLDDQPHGSPRDWSILGTMTCFHSRYQLGEPHNFTNPEHLQRMVDRPHIIALPLYLYDHSGITMRTSPFECPWDSGQVGYIWVTKQHVRREFDVKRVTQKVEEKAIKFLRDEVYMYDLHIRGEVYGYVTEDEKGEHLDSCWGFYGDPNEYMVEEAKGNIDYATKEQDGLIY